VPKEIAKIVPNHRGGAQTAQNKIPTINPRLSIINTPTKFFKKTLVKFFTIRQFLPASGQESV